MHLADIADIYAARERDLGRPLKLEEQRQPTKQK
jgi:hypothetical protein